MHHQFRVNPVEMNIVIICLIFVCLFSFVVAFIFCLSNLALGSLGDATGEPVGRGDEQEESWVPSLRN